MDEELKWYSPMNSPFVLEGFPFFNTDHLYRRLPLNPPEPLDADMERLSWNTAGGQIRFRVKTKKLLLKVQLRNGHQMDHMTATGESGFDLYLSPNEKTPRYYGTARISDQCSKEYCSELMNRPEAEWMEAVLNFPLYDGVSEVLIGIDRGAELAAPTKRAHNGRIVFYGNSLTQGGCATRPGMASTNILSRKLDMEVINEGFSGTGKCEEEVALALRKIEDMRLFILDTDGNCLIEYFTTRYPKFLDLLREEYPYLPVLVVSRFQFAKELFDNDILEERLLRKRLQEEFVESRKQVGDNNIYFLDGEKLYTGDFEEYSVDGIHATDLGFWNMASNYEPVIKEILKM